MKKQIKDKASLRAFTQAIGKIVPVKEVFMNKGVIYVFGADDGIICRLGIGTQPYYEYFNYYAMAKDSQLALQVFISKYIISENMKDLVITVKYFNHEASLDESYECSRCGKELNITMAQSYDGYNDMPLCINCMDSLPDVNLQLAKELENYSLVTIDVELKSGYIAYFDVKVASTVDNILIRAMLIVAEHLIDSKLQIKNVSVGSDSLRLNEAVTMIKCRGEWVMKPLKEVFAYTVVQEVSIIGYPFVDVAEL